MKQIILATFLLITFSGNLCAQRVTAENLYELIYKIQKKKKTVISHKKFDEIRRQALPDSVAAQLLKCDTIFVIDSNSSDGVFLTEEFICSSFFLDTITSLGRILQ